MDENESLISIRANCNDFGGENGLLTSDARGGLWTNGNVTINNGNDVLLYIVDEKMRYLTGKFIINALPSIFPSLSGSPSTQQKQLMKDSRTRT